jgi:NAD(P)H-hydrate epimerase
MRSLDDSVSLSCKLFSSHQIKEGERRCGRLIGVDMYQLMERAGHSVFECALAHFPETKTILVLTGRGNNGGDGFVIARLALLSGINVHLLTMKPDVPLSGDAEIARQAFVNSGGKIEHVYELEEYLPQSDIVVDALVGTGLNRDLSIAMQDIVRAVNQARKPVIAVDIPTGLSADTGTAMPIAIEAHITITFVAGKLGLFTADGPDYCGSVFMSGLGIHEHFCESTDSVSTLNCLHFNLSLPKRRKNSHKGTYGHVVCVGGNKGMSGAIFLAAKSALRSGAGKVSVFTHKDNVATLASMCPELMVFALDDDNKANLIERFLHADVLILGPGLGTDDWAVEAVELLFTRHIKEQTAIVLDADALNILSSIDDMKRLALKHYNLIMTPHPLEAARLLASRVAEVNKDRLQACTQIAMDYEAICVLKGAGSIISDAKHSFVNRSGNPGMATAGMGDVLSGVIAGLVAGNQRQNMAILNCVSLAVFLHGLAGDFAAKNGEIGIIATDVIEQLPAAISRLEHYR